MKTTIEKATSLQAQILCLNTLYAHSKEIIKYETDFLSQYAGKKIFKQDDSFMSKIPYQRLKIEKKQITAFGFTWWVDTHYWHKVSYGKYVKTCVSGGGYDKNGVNCNCNYQSQSFDIFNLDEWENLTTPVNADREYLNTPFDETAILTAANEAREAAKVYEQILEKVPYQFRETLYLQRLKY